MADQQSPTAIYAVFLEAQARFAEGMGEQHVTLGVDYAREIARSLRGGAEPPAGAPAFVVVPVDLLQAGTVSGTGSTVTVEFDGPDDAIRLVTLLRGSAAP